MGEGFTSMNQNAMLLLGITCGNKKEKTERGGYQIYSTLIKHLFQNFFFLKRPFPDYVTEKHTHTHAHRERIRMGTAELN